MKEEIIQKLKDMGLDDTKSEELFELLSEEVLHNIFLEYADISSDEDLAVMEQRMREAKSPEHLETIINEIAITVYGDNAQQKIEEYYKDQIETLQEQIKEANELIQRANQGDTDAKALMEKAQQSDIYKNIIDQQPT